ncbi:calcium:proton antiporter [Methylobacterium sp. P31]
MTDMKAALRVAVAWATVLAFAWFGKGWLADLTHPLAAGGLFAWLLAVIVWAAFGVVHEAEELAHRLGEPLGTLVLTLSIVIIEVALISAVMLSAKDAPTLGRDTMFAVLMIVLNGVVGLGLLVGGLRHHQQRYNLQGASAFLSVIIPLTTIALIIPNFTRLDQRRDADDPAGGDVLGVHAGAIRRIPADPDRPPQRVLPRRGGAGRGGARFRSGVFRSGRHRQSPRPAARQRRPDRAPGQKPRGDPRPRNRGARCALRLGRRADRRHRVHPGGDLGAAGGGPQRTPAGDQPVPGGATSTVGLTVPAVLTIGLLTGQTVVLGLKPTEMTLLAVTLILSTQTFSGSRTAVLEGAVDLVLFFVYLVLIFSP